MPVIYTFNGNFEKYDGDSSKTSLDDWHERVYDKVYNITSDELVIFRSQGVLHSKSKWKSTKDI